MQRRRVAVLAGGTGSVKLVRGLYNLREVDLSVVSNVGDNIWLHGLYVCPDIDTVLYGLAGILDTARGWGIKGDTFECLAAARALGATAWFALGDRDLATHITRTELMAEGKALSEVTAIIASRLSVRAKIVPATDSHVPTMIETGKGRMHLQEFWVKNRGRPAVKSVSYEGIEKASACPAAVEAISNADTIVIAPGNPISSIGPIFNIAEIKSALVKRKQDVIAVSPVVGASAISGPAAKYMKAAGLQSSTAGIAKYYSEICSSIAFAVEDGRNSASIRRFGVEPFLTNIIMKSPADEVRLARELLSRD